MPTDISEKGLETTIIDHLTMHNGYEQGDTIGYNKDYAIDEERLFRFLVATQRESLEDLNILSDENQRDAFLARLTQQLTNDGVIYTIRNGLQHLHKKFELFYVPPTGASAEAERLWKENIFSVTRQLMYSKKNNNSIDFVIFLNGLPVITCELKNNLTKQNTEDAVEQYKQDRNPKEDPTALILKFKRCIVHFAIDEVSIKMCTELKGKGSWFLPFNMGNNGGAGNPVNPEGYRTEYFWKEILRKDVLTDIILNYAQVVKEDAPSPKSQSEIGTTGRGGRTKQIFPRYHQLSVVKKLLFDAYQNGTGQKYLIQHSAGSGKSNSIAWLAHQLVSLRKDGREIFDSIIVVTDRVNLDTQIKNTIKSFSQISNIVGWAVNSGELSRLLKDGKKIIITIVHKFQYILDDIQNFHKGNKFAIIIDEAHSSQSGSLSAKMNIVLSGSDVDSAEDIEDQINKIIIGRKLMKNASYFAFTATPKNKTLEMFGEAYKEGDEVKHRAFHTYTMKQAIEEGFILDVLKNYIPVYCYFNIIKKVEDDPLFDKKKGTRKLKYFVESNKYTIEQKAEFIIEHFHSQVISRGKIGGKARVMVITESIQRAIDYDIAIKKALSNRNSQYKTILAFSGEKEIVSPDGTKLVLTEDKVNGFLSSQIEKKFKEDPYRILVVADKFQTGYDEPLLHTMYVDKGLSDIKAVQTLSRLNRAYPGKVDTCVVDFYNEPEIIQEAFSKYYTTTLLCGETDANKLNDLIAIMKNMNVFTIEQREAVVKAYLQNKERAVFEVILNKCVERYNELEIDDMVKFKGSMKSFVRTYNFLAAILPYGSSEWEKLCIFCSLLLPKLPSLPEEDLAKGITEAIDLDSYRIEAQKNMDIFLEDSDAEIEPVPVSQGGGKPEPELIALSDIITMFLEQTGSLGIEWSDIDKVRKHIEDISLEVLKNEKYQNAILNSDEENARDESDRVLNKVIQKFGVTMIEVLKAWDDPSVKKMLQDTIFRMTYRKGKSS